MRHLVLVLGDQLDPASAALDGLDPAVDAVWMAEVRAESTHVRSNRTRTALFLAAMRHYRDAARAVGRTVHYRALGEHAAMSLDAALADDLARLRPERCLVVLPGEHRVLELLRATCAAAGVPLDVLPDRHFFTTPEEFGAWAQGRRELRMEFFYRWVRKRTEVLMEDGEPAGGAWNFDQENRQPFGAQGPGMLPAPQAFPPDAVTREVLELVMREFPDHPGDLTRFDWPVTPAEAEDALQDFIRHRLAAFGPYQDALWTGEPWLYHSRLSAALNLKLLDPRRVVAAAEAAWRDHGLPIASVEGFVRQILGWREYVRGLYWTRMPAYAGHNALDAHQPLPAFYWTGDTDYACLRDAIGQTLQLGYAHHIQRLMVTGLFALLLGVEPREVHEWYLGAYVDAVEWVELPNTLGMSQFADGGVLASKPYIASGKYLARMGNACGQCRYRPDRATGADACPFTTLYWDFLDRHEARFKNHPRLALQVKNLARLDVADRTGIRAAAASIRSRLAAE